MKRVIIVGGGISGMASGIYAQKAGYESVVLEKNAVPGGECTGWDRDGCHIDGCIHWLTGTKKDTELYKLWCEVGALDNVEILHLDYFYSYDFDGRIIYFYNDYNKLRKELLSVSPEDEKVIDEFIAACKKIRSIEMPVNKPMDMMGTIEMMKLGMKMMSGGMAMQKYSKITCGKFAEQFKSPILKRIFKSMLPENYSVSSLMFSYATIASGNGGIPAGGSKAMALRMAERYKALGGNMRLNSEVSEIVISNGRAVGVRLSSGETINGDFIISACDANITLSKLLKGKYTDKRLEPCYDNLKENPIQSNVLAAFSVEGDVSDIPYSFVFSSKPYEVMGSTQDSVSMRVYSYDKSLVRNGKTTITSFVSQSPEQFDAWKILYDDKDAYSREKMRIADELMTRITERFPQFNGRIKLLDVVTPVTYEKYCGAFKGSWMAFMSTPNSTAVQNHDGRIEGIENFQLSGQWVYSPGGLPCALITGKFAVQRAEECLRCAPSRSQGA